VPVLEELGTGTSFSSIRDDEARLQLFVLAYNLGHFLRRLALPRGIKHWSLTTLREGDQDRREGCSAQVELSPQRFLARRSRAC